MSKLFPSMEGTVCIKQKRLDELLEKEAFLEALQGAGVDNWEGYDDAMEMLEEMNNGRIS